jgi:membrane protein implicated in regulation of membrane protease activity
MEAWVVWLIAAVVLGVGEIVSLSFFLAPFAGGALVAALGGATTAGSWAVFLLVSLLLLAGLRPLARAHLRKPGQLRTGTQALIGSQAVVLERIANDEGVGCVRLGGEVWTARAYDDDEVFEPGARVQVIEIRGATALVTE